MEVEEIDEPDGIPMLYVGALLLGENEYCAVEMEAMYKSVSIEVVSFPHVLENNKWKAAHRNQQRPRQRYFVTVMFSL